VLGEVEHEVLVTETGCSSTGGGQDISL